MDIPWRPLIHCPKVRWFGFPDYGTLSQQFNGSSFRALSEAFQRSGGFPGRVLVWGASTHTVPPPERLTRLTLFADAPKREEGNRGRQLRRRLLSRGALPFDAPAAGLPPCDGLFLACFRRPALPSRSRLRPSMGPPLPSGPLRLGHTNSC